MPDYPSAQHSLIADLVARLDEPLRESYEERAGIFEFEANLDRSLAEALALLEVVRLYGWPPSKQ